MYVKSTGEYKFFKRTEIISLLMAKTTDLILIAMIAGAAFFIWQNYQKNPTSQAQIQQAFRNAGFNDSQVRRSTIEGDANATFVESRGTTYRFAPGDFDKLNFAQKFLIGVDRFVPGTGLTRAVLS